MRLIKIAAPPELGPKVLETVFSAGIESVSVHQVEKRSASGQVEQKDVIDIETSTPTAKLLVEKLLAAEYFDRRQISFSTRQPRSIVSDDDIAELTKPLPEPGADLFQELWQFSHITYGLVMRVLIAGCLLAYGLIHHQILLILAGLFFLPTLPMLLAISFGAGSRQWKLVAYAAAALAVSISLLTAGGILIAAISEPPLRYNEFNSLLVSLLISAAVGIAAALAASDDGGRRELIGLAAAAQIGILPVWLGIKIIFGQSPGESGEPLSRLLSLALNIAAILTAAFIVQMIMGMPNGVKRLTDAEDRS